MLDKKIIAFFRQWLDGYFVMKALVQHLSYKAGEYQRNQRCFGRIETSLYFSIGESLYSAFGTAMGI